MSTGAHPLLPVRRVGLDGFGPEDVVVDKDGSLITGVEDGRIFRIDPRGGHVDSIIDTGGRPLGIELSANGAVVVCDARRGLLLVDPQLRRVEVLVDEVEGEPLLLCNNAAVAADGTVFFSESSRRFGLDHWRADLFEHSGTGRLLTAARMVTSTYFWMGFSSPTEWHFHRMSPSWSLQNWDLTGSPGCG